MFNWIKKLFKKEKPTLVLSLTIGGALQQPKPIRKYKRDKNGRFSK